MISKKFPGYFYQNTTQLTPGEFNILMDTAFVDSYSSYTSTTTIQDWQNLHDTEIYTRVNSFFGNNILSQSNPFYVALDAGKSIPDEISKAFSMAGLYLSGFSGATRGGNGAYSGLTFKTFNNCVSNPATWYISYGDADEPLIIYSSTGAIHGYSVTYSLTYHMMTINMLVCREDLFASDGTSPAGDNRNGVYFTIYVNFASSMEYASRVRITAVYSKNNVNTLIGTTPVLNLNNAQTSDKDPNDPYQNGPDDDGNDGGDGPQEQPVTQPTAIPDPPNLGIASCGLITVYTPTLVQLQSLASFLWSGAFDPDTWKKVFNDPMQALVGLAIVPAIPSTGGSKNIRFGSVDSGVSSSYITNPFVQKDFGSVKINKDVGSFLDYTDTKISIYLPYLGFRELSPDDVMGATLTVKYNIDVITGACAAFVHSSARGVMYAYNGSCITNVPLTGQNFSGAIQNAVTAVASGAGVIAGMASGAAPVTAMSAVSMLNSAANVALNSKPSIQRSGNLGGSAGILSVQKPFLIIQRPNFAKPDNMNHFVGNVTFKTLNLGSCSGFTVVDQVHLNGISATPSEITEIETLLKAGVIL